ncbi:hypothetical protein [Natranaerobius thermophilus]|uniref:CopG domain protein DNA-binding domain protein n=2 Tax=Natranaerobius TaxID=375928 RepID=B2A5E3_NATTJ|nr:hypothetical protein [Natranaerobius thermophilus]ACB83977.1 hypothetical protein Nther_0381 [Natranaerobius thermophilus JW/NM-WN-LF]
MSKTTFTMSVDKELHEKAKEAIKGLGVTLSDFYLYAAKVYLDDGSPSIKNRYSDKYQKIIIYLPSGEKKELKKQAIKLGLTMSELFSYALHYYFGNESANYFAIIRYTIKLNRIDESREESSSSRRVINFYLNPELSRELDYYCIENDTTRTDVIYKAVQRYKDSDDMEQVDYQGTLDQQSSIVEKASLNFQLNQHSKRLGISKSELINRAVYLYINN